MKVIMEENLKSLTWDDVDYGDAVLLRGNHSSYEFNGIVMKPDSDLVYDLNENYYENEEFVYNLDEGEIWKLNTELYHVVRIYKGATLILKEKED